MFNSLSQFYNSGIWRDFRAQLIAQRINKADGVLYSEYSGQPLIKAYDIVLHHKTPLTMQNVNDYAISLNPENILIVSQKEHNEIHNRFGYLAQRKVYYVYGSPCSGKNTFVNEIKGNSDFIVDIDLIWQCITGSDLYRKPKALNENAFTMRNMLFDMVKTRAGKWERAFVITGGAVKGERERQIELLGAEPIFIDTDKETCLKRLANDKNRDYNEWSKYINAWWADYQE